MPSVNVSVKWQKEVFPRVEIDIEQPVTVFKAQLFDLTGVHPERQKIMIKGGILKDDAEWSKLALKEGQRLMMMGTADEIPKAPEKGPVFMEDLPEEDQAHAPLGYTAGLVNLGNTCYMNSTVQCLRSVPELKSVLEKYPSSPDTSNVSHMLTVSMRDLFSELEKSNRPVSPGRFWAFLRARYPQFAQQSNTGAFMQQDAEECWTQLMSTLTQHLPPSDATARSPVTAVKDLFGIDFESMVYCPLTNEESEPELETVFTLKCHISSEVNHLHEGLKQGLRSELEKTSPKLNRSVPHFKASLINRLPHYLTVQFVRFFWKRETKQKAKILRKVDFPLVLDVFDLCSYKLKGELEKPRQLLREHEDKEAGLKGKRKMDDERMAALTEQSQSPTDMEIDEPSAPQITGFYDLVAVLTHKGRSADSGHYVAWVKQQSGKWIQYDDDNPIPQREEDIVKLSGGGDWHTAYICLYKARSPPKVATD